MKKIFLVVSLLIFMGWSCTTKEDTEDKILQKPAGKYLSEIWTFDPSSDAGSSKEVEFEYDQNRYLKRINFYIPETQQLIRHLHFFYNTNGLLNHIEVNYVGSNAMIDERFTYENKELVMIEGYKIEDSKTTLMLRTDFKVNIAGNMVEIYPYDLKDGVLVKRTYPQKYTFNSKGNLVKYHYNIGQGGFFETMEDFEYDDKINPFANLAVPYYNVVSAYLSLGECFSMNNVVRHNNYLHENGVSYQKPLYDTIIYKYEGNYPVESAEYEYNQNILVKLNSRYLYKYVDLK